MHLKRISIKNFRAIRSLEVEVGDHTVLVGGNGVGKSSIIKAVDKFFSPRSRVQIEDFHQRNTGDDIQIALSFHRFTEEEREKFASRIHGEELIVERIFTTGSNSGLYYGLTPRHPGFQAIRETNGALERRQAFNGVPREGIYIDLGTAQNANQLVEAMEKWESDHPAECELSRDDGQFLGFTNVARGSLEKYISFVFVPAVRDAQADAMDGKGSVVNQLIELLVRNVLNQKKAIVEWREKASQEYQELTKPENMGELTELSSDLDKTLKHFYSDAGINLSWMPTEELQVPLPKADVEMEEQGFSGSVEGKGHGLQRAFIFTILQHLAQAIYSSKHEPTEDNVVPVGVGNLILAIEEPELYQHPSKQKHLAAVLRNLSCGQVEGVMNSTQVLLCSHSPHFVSTDTFDEIRLAIRRSEGAGDENILIIESVDYQDVVEVLNAVYDHGHPQFSVDSLKSRLHTFSNRVSEGFFESTIVLVEGAGDEAAILATAHARGIDLLGMGIAIIPVRGKNNLDKPLIIFKQFGIPVYVIWDNDKHQDKSSVSANIALQKFCGIDEPTEFGTIIGSEFSCFVDKLEVTLSDELGADFEKKVGEVGHTFGMKAKDIKKNPIGLGEVLRRCYAGGNSSPTMDAIIDRIVEKSKI